MLFTPSIYQFVTTAKDSSENEVQHMHTSLTLPYFTRVKVTLCSEHTSCNTVEISGIESIYMPKLYNYKWKNHFYAMKGM